ncbi:uncharacterized protein [Procambarus clarkii]|uniref:uncharacterized protein n=1 Tax=Procambarus clarkii TaxID=6728 RepID=UPI001E675BE1|nr:uncharacterized protein LOC123773855 [Procambarus clarkii]
MQRIEGDKRQERLLFAYSTTTSIKRLATTTLTAISTCLSTSLNAPACQGRRKKSLTISLENLKNLSEDMALDLLPSRAEVEEVDQPAGRLVSDRKGRKFTIWSSYISTLTLTSTSYLTGTTITATAYCIAPGVSQGCFGK